MKKDKLELVDELKKFKVDAKEAIQESTKSIVNNLSLKHQLDTVEKDAKRVNLKSSEILKEIEIIKKIRKETEAFN